MQHCWLFCSETFSTKDNTKKYLLIRTRHEMLDLLRWRQAQLTVNRTISKVYRTLWDTLLRFACQLRLDLRPRFKVFTKSLSVWSKSHLSTFNSESLTKDRLMTPLWSDLRFCQSWVTWAFRTPFVFSSII